MEKKFEIITKFNPNSGNSFELKILLALNNKNKVKSDIGSKDKLNIAKQTFNYLIKLYQLLTIYIIYIYIYQDNIQIIVLIVNIIKLIQILWKHFSYILVFIIFVFIVKLNCVVRIVVIPVSMSSLYIFTNFYTSKDTYNSLGKQIPECVFRAIIMQLYLTKLFLEERVFYHMFHKQRYVGYFYSKAMTIIIQYCSNGIRYYFLAFLKKDHIYCYNLF